MARASPPSGRMAAPGSLSIRIDAGPGQPGGRPLNTSASARSRLWNSPAIDDRPALLLKSPGHQAPGKPVSGAGIVPSRPVATGVYSGATCAGSDGNRQDTARPASRSSTSSWVRTAARRLPTSSRRSGRRQGRLVIRSGSVEVHAKVEKVRGSIDKDYGGAPRFIRELNEVFIDDAYTLAGFAISQPGKDFGNPAGMRGCAGWDCEKRVPPVQAARHPAHQRSTSTPSAAAAAAATPTIRPGA